MQCLTNVGNRMMTDNLSPHQQHQTSQKGIRSKKSKNTWQQLKKIDQKVCTGFFLFCLIGVGALTLNNLFFKDISLGRIVAFMLGIGTFGALGWHVFIKAWHCHGWYRCLPPMIKVVRQINFHKVFIFGVLVMAGMFLGSKVFAGTQLQWVTPKPSTKQGKDGVVLHTDFNTSFIKGNTSNLSTQHGYYGFGLGLGYQFGLSAQNTLSTIIQYNHHSKSTFADREGQQFSTSLHDLDLLLWHQYRPMQWLSFGGITGVAFVWGFNDHPKASPRFYRNLLPVIGFGVGFKLTEQLSVNTWYLHYFGKKDLYQSKSGLPTIERFSLGVSYVF